MNDEHLHKYWCGDCGVRIAEGWEPTKGCLDCDRWGSGWRIAQTQAFKTITTQFVECRNCEEIFHIDDGWWGRDRTDGESVKKRKCKSCHKTCDFAKVPCGALIVEAGEIER